jgi:protein ImuB
MRLAVLLFPRLAPRLALRSRPELQDRLFVLIAGAGDEALVAACSPGAAAVGVLPGMSAGQARGRCPGAAFLPDNASACLEELERIATILRLKATDRVAIGGRDHLILDLGHVSEGPDGEARVARRLAGLAEAWSGLEARAGVGDSRADAYDAARASRGGPVVCPPGEASEEAFNPFRSESVSIDWSARGQASALEARAALVRGLSRATAILEGRQASYRTVRLTLHWEDESRQLVVPSSSPLHTGEEALALLTAAAGVAGLEGVTGFRVSLERLGPDVQIAPCAANRAGRPMGRTLLPFSNLRRAS